MLERETQLSVGNNLAVCPQPKRMHYQLDAPVVVWRLVSLGLCAFVIAMILLFIYKVWPLKVWLGIWAVMLFWASCYFLMSLAMMVTSYITKPILVRKLLQRYLNKNHKQVIDVGIGSGLGAIIVAAMPWRPQIVGIDTWSLKDQSNNSLETLKRNCFLTKTQACISIVECDMRQIQLNDNSQDAAIAILSIHNIETQIGRANALADIVRVVRPGGVVILIDYKAHGEYINELTKLGCQQITQSRFYWSACPPLKCTFARVE